MRPIKRAGTAIMANPLVQIPMKTLIRDCIIIGLMIGVGSVHRFAMIAVFVFLVGFALTSTLNAIKALSVLFLLIYLNPLLNIQFAQMMILRWAVFFAATGRIYLEMLNKGIGKVYEIRPVFYLHVFCGLALICNAISNPISPAGYLKLFAFGFGVTAVFAGVAQNQVSQSRIFTWILAIIIIVVVGSLPLTLTPAGYFSKIQSVEIAEGGQYVEANPELIGGFMGILGHAQSFGTVTSLAAVFLFITFAYSRFTPKKALFILLMVTLFLIYLSHARTAILSTMIGIAFVVCVATANLSASRRVFEGISSGLKTMIIATGASLVILLAAGLTMKSSILNKFMSKGSDQENTITGFYQGSRGALIELSMHNFSENPVFGIGFGRNSWEAIGGVADLKQGGILGLAFAPTEKGMLYSAVLEETGLVGFTAFMVMIGSFFIMFIRQANVYGAGIFAVVLLLNMGEMNFFAMGGLGMLEWIFIAVAGALGDKCSDKRF